MAAEPAPSLGISIVTIGLNAARELPLTLESVIGQDYPNLEILVLDGMSWDDSHAVLQRYSGVVDRIVTREDAGIYHAMNDALDLVSKEYVLFMNAGDQFYSANAISRMVSALEGAPDAFYGNHIYVDGRREIFRRSAPFELIADRLARGEIDGNWLDAIPAHQATFARADMLRHLRFDTRLRISADHELLFRAHEQGASMQYVDELVCHYFGGGFSALMGERTRLEGASVYRRFSDRADLVDKFFYPGGAPLDPQTQRTGIKLGGFYPEETWIELADLTRGGDWVSGAGCELLSPERPSTGIELIGHNSLDDQRIDILLDGETIASAAVPRDLFRSEISFDHPVPPSSILALRPARMEMVGQGRRAEVAFALRAFRFSSDRHGFDEGLPPGTMLRFQSGSADDFVRILGTGWSAPEPTHLWAMGPHSDLWLKIAASARRFRMAVSGNPHVQGEAQELSLLVNGTVAVTVSTDRGRQAEIEVDCTAAPWRMGEINHVILRPSAFARPPAEMADSRDLSICLWSLVIE